MNGPGGVVEEAVDSLGASDRKGLIDVLEGNYGGDVTKMPYVVNKEAFKN